MSESIVSQQHVSYLKEESRFKGRLKNLFAWICTTDHKRIGLLYLFVITIFFIVGAVQGLLMKLELMAPGANIMGSESFSVLSTLHGIIMVFAVAIPGLTAVFGNFFLPIMLGTNNVAFPKLNLVSWYVYIIGIIFILLSQFGYYSGFDPGWTFNIPYGILINANILPVVIGIFLIGLSSIALGINFIVTVHRYRAQGMSWFKMPLFPWSLYAAAWIQLLATPVLVIALFMIFAESTMAIGMLDPMLGGDPTLYQHLFWIYARPAIYIMILPAMGIISEIIPTFSQKTIFSYRTTIVAMLAIAFLGFFVWGQHMVTSGIGDRALSLFSFFALIITVPMIVVVFNWLGTMHKGSLNITTPFYWAVSFIFIFLVAGLTGLMFGSLATNVYVHRTQFEIAHFHYIVFGSVSFAFMGAIHYWFPKIFGRMYNKKWANIGFLVFFIGFNLLFLPMFMLGYQGLPGHFYDYPPGFHPGNLASSTGAIILILGALIIIINLIRNLRFGKKCDDMNPWGGKTLEWTISTPPPSVNFDKLPVITNDPYDYN